METTLEGVLVVRKEGKVIAFGHNDMDRRAVIFYPAEGKEMGLEEFKSLFDTSALIPKE